MRDSLKNNTIAKLISDMKRALPFLPFTTQGQTPMREKDGVSFTCPAMSFWILEN